MLNNVHFSHIGGCADFKQPFLAIANKVLGGDLIYWLENKFKFLERFEMILLCLISFFINGYLIDVSFNYRLKSRVVNDL